MLETTVDTYRFKEMLSLLNKGALVDGRWSDVGIEARGKGTVVLSVGDVPLWGRQAGSSAGEVACQWAALRLTGQEVASGGSASVALKRLCRIMGAMKAEQTTFRLESAATGSHLYVTSGNATVRLLAVEGVSEPPPADGSSTPLDLHVGAIAEVARFASPDDGRPVLQCVSYSNGEYAATDSYRLGIVNVPERAVDLDFLIGPFAVDALRNLAPHKWVEAAFFAESNVLAVDFGDLSIRSRQLDGKFPDYRNLVPADGAAKQESVCGGDDLRQAVEQARDLVGAFLPVGSVLQIQNGEDSQVVMRSESEEEFVEVRCEGSISTPVAFNPRYLCSLLEGTNADTLFGGKSFKPWGLHEDAEYCAGATRTRIIMPVRTG